MRGKASDPDRPERLEPAGRLALLALAVGLVVVLATARRLTPDPRGFGTHERLGRPPCALRVLTGRPCPTCGLTTAFAWTVRGDLARAWRANPSGPVLALGCLGLIPWAIASAWRGRGFGVRSAGSSLMGLVVLATGLVVLSWTARRALSVAWS